MEEIKYCKKHGETLFVLRKDGNFRCRKCSTESVQKRRDNLKIMAIEYKGDKCEICGYCKYIGALEFHHLNPAEKDFSISASGKTRSFELVKKELDKCILLCANCHREIHENPSIPANNNIMGNKICELKNCSFLQTCMKVHKDYNSCTNFTNKVVSNEEYKNNFFSTWDGSSGNL